MRLISHVNNDGDLIEAWLRYYQNRGVCSFHLILHGPFGENAALHALRDRYPIVVEEMYEGEFTSEEKERRLNRLIAKFPRQWLVLVDADEFVELPYSSLRATVRKLELLGANALYAPMLQRIKADGSLDSPEVISDPFAEFPLCSADLYARMGVRAAISKFPVFYCDEGTQLSDGGNHGAPNGSGTILVPMRAVTHHFKWRGQVLTRLARRINSSHSWRHQSVGFEKYLNDRGQLPLEGTFPYSRRDLFRRGLLAKVGPLATLQCLGRKWVNRLPAAHQSAIRQFYRGVSRTKSRPE